MLPLDLVLVRHGQSEGNLAKRRSEAGDHSAYTTAFRERHSGSYRLTNLGREQAERAGHWIRQHLCPGFGFDRYYTSEYIRAKETAIHLGMPGALWYTDPYLTERSWGDLDITAENEREAQFSRSLQMREIEPFFWRPPNGESFMELCLRVDRVLDTFHRECSDKRVLVVCHGEVMRAFQARIERLPQWRFRELVLSDERADRIHNCEVMHYTRRDPEADHTLQPYVGWVRKVRPAEDPLWTSGWWKIERHRSPSIDLRRDVDASPILIRE